VRKNASSGVKRNCASMVQRLSRVKLDKIWLLDSSSFSAMRSTSTQPRTTAQCHEVQYYYMMSGVTGCTNAIPRGAQSLRVSATKETQIWLAVWNTCRDDWTRCGYCSSGSYSYLGTISHGRLKRGYTVHSSSFDRANVLVDHQGDPHWSNSCGVGRSGVKPQAWSSFRARRTVAPRLCPRPKGVRARRIRLPRYLEQ